MAFFRLHLPSLSTLFNIFELKSPICFEIASNMIAFAAKCEEMDRIQPILQDLDSWMVNEWKTSLLQRRQIYMKLHTNFSAAQQA